MMSDWVATYDAVAAQTEAWTGNADWQVHESQEPPPGHPGWRVSNSTIDGKGRCIVRTAIRFGWPITCWHRRGATRLRSTINLSNELNLGLGQ